MSWESEIKEMAWRRERALEMGGPDAIARQHQQKKLTARERIDRLLDPGSFREIGTFAGSVRYREDGTVESIVPANTLGRGGLTAVAWWSRRTTLRSAAGLPRQPILRSGSMRTASPSPSRFR